VSEKLRGFRSDAEKLYIYCPTNHSGRKWYALDECKRYRNTSGGFDYYCPKCGNIIAYSEPIF